MTAFQRNGITASSIRSASRSRSPSPYVRIHFRAEHRPTSVTIVWPSPGSSTVRVDTTGPGQIPSPTVEIVAGLPGYVPPVVAQIVPEKQTNPEEQIIQIPEDSLSGAVEGIAESATQSQLASSEGSLVSSISVAAAYRCGAAAEEMISEFAASSETEIAASSETVPPGQGNPVQSQDFAGAGTCVYRAFPETAEIL